MNTELSSLRLERRGKVRDLYTIDDQHLLIVASDRMSAFDVILPTPIPGKGEILTAISNFWFGRFRGLIPNHFAELTLREVLPDAEERARIAKRAVVARRLKTLPVEAIVRGYLIGSGWKDYQRGGAICGIALPQGLELAQRLPEAIFTPSTKAAVGDHDENVSFQHAANVIGRERAEQVRDVSLELYREAGEFALSRGIIIADTKFEFGLDDDENLTLIDEALTPDSSRFWARDEYRQGQNPASFDKQYVRDYLETLNWDKTPPGPELPPEIVRNTRAKYLEALQRLTGRSEP